MNYFDRYDEIRRLMDRVTSVPDPIRVYLAQEQQRQAEWAAATRSPSSILDDLNRVQADAQFQLRLLDTQSAASVVPDLNRAQAQAEAQLRLLDGRSASSV